MKTRLNTVTKLSLLTLFSLPVLSSCAASKIAATSKSVTKGYAPVNGLRMYYEIHGSGEGTPLVLIHGGGSTIDSTWGRILPYLAETRQVIALEEQAHGRTADIDRVVSFENTADDVVALLKFLRIERADIFGFSNGATTALQIAIRHPEAVRKIIPASGLFSRAGAFAGFWTGFKNANIKMLPEPLRADFVRVNPDPTAIQKMFDRDVYRMAHFKDIPERALKKIEAPALVITGEKDVGSIDHARKLAHLLKHGQFVVFPGGHGAYLGASDVPPTGPSAPQATALIVADFLK